ncbi:MAG: hypothetical protein GXP26_01895, partial [Planctomycetes bacterium]|nr:hypothetical protein [Planctomycetota bacterium]
MGQPAPAIGRGRAVFPALWYLSRRISTLREYCCDEMTCQAMAGAESKNVPEPKLRYATALLHVAELAKSNAVAKGDLAALAASGRSPSELRRRVARLFGEPVHEPVRVSRTGMLTLAAVALLVACGPMIWPTEAQTTANATAQPLDDNKTTGNKKTSNTSAITFDLEYTEVLEDDLPVRVEWLSEEEKQRINNTPINSVEDAIEILVEGPKIEPTKVWARAIKYLVNHKEVALPALIKQLDSEKRDHPISKLAFALRAVGDPRAIPVLIRAFPHTLQPSRSDFGLRLEDKPLCQFMQQHDYQGKLRPGSDSFDYGRAFHEVIGALHRLTGQNFGEMEFNWIHLANTESQRAQQRKLFHAMAQRWADWWEENWDSVIDDDKYSKVNLSKLGKPIVTLAGRKQPPVGLGVKLGVGHNGWIVQSVHESTRRCFVDLDTSREAGWPNSLPPMEKTGLDSPELLAWARKEGFDMMGVSHTPKGENAPLFCLRPIDMSTWQITAEEHRDIEQAIAGKKPYPLSRPVKLMVPLREVKRPYDYEYGGAAFLFVTREGTAGLIRMTGQVTEAKNISGQASGPDGRFSSVGFYRGAKISFAAMTEPTNANPPKEETVNDLQSSILRGRISDEEVQGFEAKLLADPENLLIRSRLLRYYFGKQRHSADIGEIRNKHIEWIIQNRPEAKIAGSPDTSLNPTLDGEVYFEAKKLWLRQVEIHKKDATILGNAAAFLLLYDKEISEDLLKKAQALEPKNHKWPERLGRLYSLGIARKSDGVKRERAAKSLAQLEKALLLIADKNQQFYLLADLALVALEADEQEKSENYARQLLSEAPERKKNWNYGNAIHHGNQILGRIALAADDLEKAKKYLLESGKTPGSPQLNSFGPSMVLAKELLKKGEREVVIEYFQQCGNFWK